MRIFFQCVEDCDFDVIFMHKSNIICRQQFGQNSTCFGAHFGTYRTHTFLQYYHFLYLNYSVHLGNSSIPFLHSEYQRPIIFEPDFPRPHGIRHAVHSHYFLVRFALLIVLCIIALAILGGACYKDKQRDKTHIKDSKLLPIQVDLLQRNKKIKF